MKKYFITIIFLAFTHLPIELQADDHTADQHKKIQQIQNVVRHDLMRGDIEHARNQLDEATGNFHSEEIELAMIQTLMQAGEYRHALSAAAHTQAEHQDSFDATIFYAWLLAIGGQAQPAKNLLLSSLEKYQNPDLKKLLTQINNDQFDSNAFRSNNFQLGPVVDTKHPVNSKFLASGVLSDATHVVTNRASLGKNKKFFVQNGVGRVFKAYLDETFTDAYLARLVLESAAPITDIEKVIDKTPFPGTPVYTIGFAHDVRPNWPRLRVDILGSPIEVRDNLYSLNSQSLDYGTGIYNLSGLLIGVVVNDGTITRKLRVIVDKAINNDGKKTIHPKVPADLIYERALKNTVQLFVAVK